MLAMAIACNPRLLIADEPTTALDVTIQAQMLALLLRLQRERGMALVLITHDLGVVAEVAERVIVMYAGQVVEEAAVPRIFEAPSHPYTEALLAALPERNVGRRRLQSLGGVVPGAFDRPGGCLLVAALPLRAGALPDRAARRCSSSARAGRAASFRCRAAPKRAEVMTEATIPAVLEAEALTKHYPVSAGFLKPHATVQALRGGVVLARCRPHPRRRRRVGLRQEHARPPGDDARAADRRAAPPRRRRRRRRRRGQAQGAAAHRADGVPEPVRQPQPAQEDRPGAGGAAGDQHRALGRPTAPSGRGRCSPGWACGPSTTRAIRTCSPAGSGSASPSPGR